MGRSYLGPPDKGIRQVLFPARERGGGAIPFFVYNWPWLVAGSPDADQVSFISQTSSSRLPPKTTTGITRPATPSLLPLLLRNGLNNNGTYKDVSQAALQLDRRRCA